MTFGLTKFNTLLGCFAGLPKKVKYCRALGAGEIENCPRHRERKRLSNTTCRTFFRSSPVVLVPPRGCLLHLLNYYDFRGESFFYVIIGGQKNKIEEEEEEESERVRFFGGEN